MVARGRRKRERQKNGIWSDLEDGSEDPLQKCHWVTWPCYHEDFILLGTAIT